LQVNLADGNRYKWSRLDEKFPLLAVVIAISPIYRLPYPVFIDTNVQKGSA